MLTVKQIFELARDEALEQYSFAIKSGNFSGTRTIFQTIEEIQNVLENLDKKENYIASSNPATETAVLFALNLKEGDVQKLKAQEVQQPHTMSPEYIVQIQIVNAPHIGSGINKKFYSTLEEANKEFLGWKTANENMNCYFVTLFEKIGEGQYKVLARSLPHGCTTEPKPKTKPAQLYQVRIIHLNNDEQVLRFPILAAAQATFELLKYELKVGRIRGAKIVRVIQSVGMKETLVSIGETEEEDIF